MTQYPSSKEDLTLRHHFVYYTFLPLVGVLVLSIVSVPVLWYLDYLSFITALALPWGVMGIAMIYIGFLGDYVIPAETYRKLMNGEWDNE